MDVGRLLQLVQDCFKMRRYISFTLRGLHNLFCIGNYNLVTKLTRDKEKRQKTEKGQEILQALENSLLLLFMGLKSFLHLYDNIYV